MRKRNCFRQSTTVAALRWNPRCARLAICSSSGARLFIFGLLVLAGRLDSLCAHLLFHVHQKFDRINVVDIEAQVALAVCILNGAKLKCQFAAGQAFTSSF